MLIALLNACFRRLLAMAVSIILQIEFFCTSSNSSNKRTFCKNCKMNGKKIDAIQFIQDKENVRRHEAIKKAQSMINESIQPVQAKPIIQTENLTKIFVKLKQALYSSSKARAYAESRSIYNAKLEAGYNNGTHYNKLKNCIIFPLNDKQITSSVFMVGIFIGPHDKESLAA